MPVLVERMAAELQWQEDADAAAAAEERRERAVARERPQPEADASRDTPEAKAARAVEATSDRRVRPSAPAWADACHATGH